MMTVVVNDILWSGSTGGTIFHATGVDGRKNRIIASRDVMPRPPVPGEVWAIDGKKYDHPDYGLQYRATEACLNRPSGRLIIQVMSNSPNFPGIGERRARLLWDSFGEQLYELLDRNDHSPYVSVVGEDLARVVNSGWGALATEAAIFAWLDRRGINGCLATKLLDIYGNDVITKLDENPYRLLAFSSWKTTDTMARAMGMQNNDERRLAAAVDAILIKRLEASHTCAARAILADDIRKLIRCAEPVAQAALDTALEESALVATGAWLQGLGPAAMENYIAEQLHKMASGDFPAPQPALRNQIDAGVLTDFFHKYRQQFVPLNNEQQKAITMVLSSPVSVICGGAGVGKTTVLHAILEAARPHDIPVHMMALSGRAARRMSEATGQPAMTIAAFMNAVDRGTLRLDDESIIAIDESSMLDLPTTYRLLRRLEPGCKLVLLGDPGQLPPIGFGLVFHALVDARVVPMVELTEIHRQAAHTGIPRVGRAIRAGVVPDLMSYNGIDVGVSFVECARELVGDIVLDIAAELGGFSELQIISAVKAGPAGAQTINSLCRRSLPLGQTWAGNFAVGEPVIWLSNDYKLGLMNGSMGKVTGTQFGHPVVTWDEGEMVMDDVSDMDLAYAITVHKSQGSQWPRIIMPVYDSRLLDRSLLYTAITRAQLQVVLVGDRLAFERAVQEPANHHKRETGMLWWLLNSGYGRVQ